MNAAPITSPLENVTSHQTLRRLVWGLTLFLGFIVGPTALVMSYAMSIGGANETAATTLYAVLFLAFLGMGFGNIRREESFSTANG